MTLPLWSFKFTGKSGRGAANLNGQRQAGPTAAARAVPVVELSCCCCKGPQLLSTTTGIEVVRQRRRLQLGADPTGCGLGGGHPRRIHWHPMLVASTGYDASRKVVARNGRTSAGSARECRTLGSKKKPASFTASGTLVCNRQTKKLTAQPLTATGRLGAHRRTSSI